MLARLQLLILQRTLVIELQCHQLSKTGRRGVEGGDIFDAEAMARASLKSQLEVNMRLKGVRQDAVWAGSPLGRILWCCEINWPLSSY